MKTCPKIVSYEDATVLSLGFDLDARNRGEGGGKEEGGNTTTTSVFFFSCLADSFPGQLQAGAVRLSAASPADAGRGPSLTHQNRHGACTRPNWKRGGRRRNVTHTTSQQRPTLQNIYNAPRNVKLRRVKKGTVKSSLRMLEKLKN